MNAQADERCFTLEEANQRLPLVRSIVRDIVELYRDVHNRRWRLVKLRQRKQPTPNRDEKPDLYREEVQQMEHDLDRDINRLDAFVKELTDLEVNLKDPVAGHVDFRSVVNGEDGYLCWKLGEEEIGYWHAADAGIEGRQSILEGTVQ